jgi:hypothetical protein
MEDFKTVFGIMANVILFVALFAAACMFSVAPFVIGVWLWNKIL